MTVDVSVHVQKSGDRTVAILLPDSQMFEKTPGQHIPGVELTPEQARSLAARLLEVASDAAA